MLRIRLQRTGNKNNPTFRLVVTEKSNAAKGKSLERIGHYLPTRDPVEFDFDQKRIEHWISVGAIPTDTVARLLSKAGVKGLEKYQDRYTKQKKKKEVEEEPAPAAPAAPAEEAPKEEAPVEEKKEKEEEKPADEPKEEEKKEEPASASAEATADKEEKKEEDDKKESEA